MLITKCLLCSSTDIDTEHKEVCAEACGHKDPVRYKTKNVVLIERITEQLTIRCRTCNHMLFYQTKIYLKGIKDESKHEKEEIENQEFWKKVRAANTPEKKQEIRDYIESSRKPESEQTRKEREQVAKWQKESDIYIDKILTEAENKKAIDSEEKEEPPASSGGETG